MESFDKILLVYDGSPEAKSALIRCAHLAAALSATVDVISVIDAEHFNAVSGGLLSGEAFAHLQLLAEQTVSEATIRLKSHGVVAHGHVGFGRSIDVLPQQAALFRSCMVMIGHRADESGFGWWSARPLYTRLAEHLKGLTLVTVTCH
jgi:nucleotide-binding universal stress UspA family protein